MNFSVADITALQRKYDEIRALRTEGLTKERAEPRMRALAKEFPGSLRELQGLPMEAIERRREKLAAAAANNEIPAWATIHIAYHRILRCVLLAKRSRAGDAKTFAELASNDHESDVVALLVGEMIRVRSESRGSRVAIALVAKALGLEEHDVRAELWREIVHETKRSAKAT